MAQNHVKYKFIVIGGSAGSLDVLLQIVAALPGNMRASFLVVVHRKSDAESLLPDLLSSRTTLAVREVEDKEKIHPGTIYIAPADYHLLVESKNNFSLDASEKIQFSRPSIDVTFESVAEVFGKTAVAILLSGANADGAEGLKRVKDCGGHTIVQDPATADVSFMPQQAVNLRAMNAVVGADQLPGYIKQLLETA